MSLLKRPTILSNGFAKEGNQSLNRSVLDRSGSRSQLDRSGFVSSKRTWSASNLQSAGKLPNAKENLLGINTLRRKSDSPDRHAPNLGGKRMRNNLLSASSSDGFSFKKRIADSVVARLDGSYDIRSPSVISFDGKMLNSPRSSDIWGLRSTNANSSRLSRSPTLLKNSNTVGRTSPSKALFQSAGIGRLGIDLDSSNFRSQMSSPRGNITTSLIEQGSQLRGLSAYKSKILSLDRPNNRNLAYESPLSNSRSKLIQNPLLSSNNSVRISPYQINQQRQFLCSFMNDGISEFRASSGYRPSYSPYYGHGQKSVSGLASFDDDLRRIRVEMHANKNDYSYRPSTQFSKPLSPAEAKKSEDILERLFDISPEKWMHKISRPDSQKRAFGKAVSTGKIHELQDTLTDAADRDFNNLSLNHIQEMLKLSSIIVQRVKASSYYHTRS